MKIINLTGHDLILGNDDGKTVTYPSEGRVRHDPKYRTVDLIPLGDSGIVIPLRELYNGRIRGSLREPEEATLLVVSDIVAKRLLRDDVVSPSDYVKEGRTVRYARSLLRHRKE